ncbi:uncharacterized protein AAGF69_015392 isoform 1-T1 [Amazona ochrocephala]
MADKNETPEHIYEEPVHIHLTAVAAPAVLTPDNSDADLESPFDPGPIDPVHGSCLQSLSNLTMSWTDTWRNPMPQLQELTLKTPSRMRERKRKSTFIAHQLDVFRSPVTDPDFPLTIIPTKKMSFDETRQAQQ